MMEDARLPRHVMTGRLCSAEYLDAIEPQKQKKKVLYASCTECSVIPIRRMARIADALCEYDGPHIKQSATATNRLVHPGRTMAGVRPENHPPGTP